MSLSKEDIIEAVAEMSVIEVVDLVKAMEEKFGVVAAPPSAAAPAGGDDSAGAPVAEEKTTFDLVLTTTGDRRVKVIQAVRALTGLGLKDAKDLVDKAPGVTIKEGISKDEAEAAKTQIEEAGGSVELK